jgi:A/G-specific adenine glycosylase
MSKCFDYKETVPYLLQWFDYNARILPWREHPSPYEVWISEIMLQQTRVEAVKGYFDRFIEALPDLKSLAEVSEERLLKLWEGLGYYSRARNLKKAAQMVLKEHNGELPAAYEQLLKLPGIGPYTAGAIASIAFGIAVPAVDGNVLRVAKRLSGSYDDIAKESVRKELQKELAAIMPEDRPGDFNQALMELGATVCLPNGKPLCEKCPLMHMCRAFREDIAAELPVKSGKKERRIEERTVLLLEYEDKLGIRRRPDKGLLAGLWELPALAEYLTAEELHTRLREWDMKPDSIEVVGKAKHIFTHIEWHMLAYRVKLKELTQAEQAELTWASRQELKEKYTLPNAFQKFINI